VVKNNMVGTITGVFDEALDGIAARLIRKRKFGYTVELLESKPPFHQGDTVHLSPAEFLLPHAHTRTLPRACPPTNGPGAAGVWQGEGEATST
jgi:hypothetical protein